MVVAIMNTSYYEASFKIGYGGMESQLYIHRQEAMVSSLAMAG